MAQGKEKDFKRTLKCKMFQNHLSENESLIEFEIEQRILDLVFLIFSFSNRLKYDFLKL